MIKNFFRYLFYAIFLFVVTFVMIPKTSFYFMGEQKLFKKGVIISNEKINEGLFSFDISDGDIIYNDLRFANVSSAKLKLHFINNRLNIENINIAKEFQGFVPGKIKSIQIDHTILDPAFINISSTGDMGDIDGRVDLIKRTIKLSLTASKLMKSKYKMILKQMKNKDGIYKYEYRF